MTSKMKRAARVAGLCLFATSTLLATTAHADWRLEDVDVEPVVRSSSVRIDTAGNPAVAFGGKTLSLATFNGATWNIEEVPGAGLCGVGYVSLAVASSGDFHIAFLTALEPFSGLRVEFYVGFD